MAYSYDYFVSALKCPVCNTVSSADDSIEMYTYIRKHANAEFLGVGSSLYIDLETLANNACDGYLKIKTPKLGDQIYLLNPWRCQTCGTYNWAKIVILDDVISEISSVPLDRGTLEVAHLISNEARFVAESLLGISAEQLKDKDVVQVLQEKL